MTQSPERNNSVALFRQYPCMLEQWADLLHSISGVAIVLPSKALHDTIYICTQVVTSDLSEPSSYKISEGV